MPSVSLLFCADQMQASLKRCLGGILQVTISDDAQVSIHKDDLDIRDPIPHLVRLYLPGVGAWLRGVRLNLLRLLCTPLQHQRCTQCLLCGQVLERFCAHAALRREPQPQA